MLTIGVFGTSTKKNEKRVPIHPQHLDQIAEEIRSHLFFEQGYGLRFGLDDQAMAEKVGGVLSRENLYQQCDVALLPKPVQEDFDLMKEKGIIWGWPHCVQQKDFTQSTIDRRLTLIAWEAMHEWSPAGEWQMHTFQKNNEIAGYAGVFHALNLVGIDGNYGPQRKASIIGFGSVSRGAIHGLKARGFNDITVYIPQDFKPASRIANINYLHFTPDEAGRLMVIQPDGRRAPFHEALAQSAVIVNGILQDTDHPLMFVEEHQIDQLINGTLIIDISCDEGLGFSFAKPTTFDKPIFKVGHLHYYAVDHTPSLLWDGASWEISKSLLPYLPIIMAGPEKWEQNLTVKRAIEIQDGVIQNPKILTFQNRAAEYPHEILGAV